MTIDKLQNGSDIRGVAMPGIEGQTPNLGPAETFALTWGFIDWLKETSGKEDQELKLALARDPRLSGEDLSAYIERAAVARGVKVCAAGLGSTPAVFYATLEESFACDGGIMITASHLPWNRNGFKYFGPKGGLDKSDISDIIQRAKALMGADDFEEKLGSASKEGASSKGEGLIARVNLMDKYAEKLRKDICRAIGGGTDPKDSPLKGLHIVVDAGNGGGGFFATEVLQTLGADISGSQFLEPDGRFPNHSPNPENPEAMAALSHAVLDHNADLGLIFDTDVDRVGAVDDCGGDISRNAIIALAAAMIAEEHRGTTIVTDSVTSDELTVFLQEELGMKHFRYKRGYRNVINKAIELNEGGIDCQLAIETSGHGAYKENYFLDDGAYLATKIVANAARLAKQGKKIGQLIEGLDHPLEAAEARLPIDPAVELADYGDRLIKDLKEWVVENEVGQVVEPNYEGVRISFHNPAGWCLLRKSLHDPIMPLNIESTNQGGVARIAGLLLEFFESYPEVETSKLKDLRI